MLGSIPLLIIPFILYNIGLTGVIGSAGGDPWATVLLSFAMMSGGVFTMTLGDALIVIALILLFVEVVKSTRTHQLLDRRPPAVDLRLRRLPGRVPAGQGRGAFGVLHPDGDHAGRPACRLLGVDPLGGTRRQHQPG